MQPIGWPEPSIGKSKVHGREVELPNPECERSTKGIGGTRTSQGITEDQELALLIIRSVPIP